MASPAAPSLKAVIRFWWTRNAETAGLGIAIAVMTVVGIAAISQTRRDNPFVYTGVVTGFSTLSSETGAELYATVHVDKRTTAAPIDRHNGCVVGGHIALRKVHVASGEIFVASQRGCDLASTTR